MNDLILETISSVAQNKSYTIHQRIELIQRLLEVQRTWGRE